MHVYEGTSQAGGDEGRPLPNVEGVIPGTGDPMLNKMKEKRLSARARPSLLPDCDTR